MEYATSKRWLFSTSGTLLHRVPSKYRLITLAVSGQYREGAL